MNEIFNQSYEFVVNEAVHVLKYNIFCLFVGTNATLKSQSMSLTEGTNENSNVLLSPERLLLEVPQGLHNSMAITWLIIWYISSASTLFSNKFILSSYQGDAFSLGNNISNNFVC